jgi:hypothetical protein
MRANWYGSSGKSSRVQKAASAVPVSSAMSPSIAKRPRSLSEIRATAAAPAASPIRKVVSMIVKA